MTTVDELGPIIFLIMIVVGITVGVINGLN